MKTIDLINGGKNFEITTFPDGEPHIKFTEDFDRKDTYRVLCRITNPNQLFIVMQVGDILNRQGIEWDLYIFYLMSMRMDRVINFNEAFSSSIVANAINTVHPRNTYVYSPHSDRCWTMINNGKPLVDIGYVKDDIDYLEYHFIKTIYKKVKSDVDTNYAICFPDTGAADRYLERVTLYFSKAKVLFNKDIYYFDDYIVMKKVRDLKNNGAIKSLEILNDKPDPNDFNRLVIYDDLCDGGGTFCLAAKLLKEAYPDKPIDIAVKHVVNKNGLKRLAETFDNVFITNSYCQWDDEWGDEEFPKNIHIFDIVEQIKSWE